MSAFGAFVESSSDEEGPAIQAGPSGRQQGGKRGKGKGGASDLRSLAFTSSTGQKRKGKKKGKKQAAGTSAETPKQEPAPQPAPPRRVPTALTPAQEREVAARRTAQYAEDMEAALQESLRTATAADVAAVWKEAGPTSAGKGGRKKKSRKGRSQVTLAQHLQSQETEGDTHAPPGLHALSDGVAVVGGKVVAVAGGSKAPPGLSADSLVQQELRRAQAADRAAEAASEIDLQAAARGDVGYDRSRENIQPLQGDLPGISSAALALLPESAQHAIRLAAAHKAVIAEKGRGGAGAVQVPLTVPLGNGDLLRLAAALSTLLGTVQGQKEQLESARHTVRQQQDLIATGMSTSQTALATSVQQLQAENEALGAELAALHRRHAKALGAMRGAGLDTSKLEVEAEVGAQRGSAAPAGQQGKPGKKGSGKRKGGKGKAPVSQGAEAAAAPKLAAASLASLTERLKEASTVAE